MAKKRPAVKVPIRKPPPRFDLGVRVKRPECTEPYVVLREQQKAAARRAGQSDEVSDGRPLHLPTHRRLRIYTQDPGTPKAHHAVTELEVPYEPLAAGPTGSMIVVEDRNQTAREVYEPIELDHIALAMTAGLKPSTNDPKFAQQMTYALAAATYHRFRRALGRDPQFSFPPHAGDTVRDRPAVKLHVHPHAFEEANAYYDPDKGALRFGYTRANRQAKRLNQPGAIVFTSLSHDVVIHETTHALLDGLRARFMLPTNGDVDGFHEGFADLVALLQRFGYRELVARAIADAKGGLTSRLLVDLARQFGETTSDGDTPLRTAFLTPGDVDAEVPKADQYGPNLEAHDMGAILLRSVFDAFRTVFDQKTAQLRGLAPPEGVRLPEAMVDLLAGEAVRLAEQFLNLVIRAVDYCPPVDVRLGEYLRALITADYDLVPDDPWGYREALVRAFRRHGIRVDGVLDLSEDALLWRGPERRLPSVMNLGATEIPLGWLDRMLGKEVKVAPANPQQIQYRRANIMGTYVSRPEHLYYFGLAVPSRARQIELPVVESVRQAQRVGPDGTFNEDLIVEIIQRRQSKGLWMYGGSTVVLSNRGVIRYIIAKNVMSRAREAQFHEYLKTAPDGYIDCFSDQPGALAGRLRLLHKRRGA